jgi:hypothetical protein
MKLKDVPYLSFFIVINANDKNLSFNKIVFQKLHDKISYLNLNEDIDLISYMSLNEDRMEWEVQVTQVKFDVTVMSKSSMRSTYKEI